jgi:hypothetical protein
MGPSHGALKKSHSVESELRGSPSLIQMSRKTAGTDEMYSQHFPNSGSASSVPVLYVMLPDGISLEAPADSARFRSESRRVGRYCREPVFCR